MDCDDDFLSDLVSVPSNCSARASGFLCQFVPPDAKYFTRLSFNQTKFLLGKYPNSIFYERKTTTVCETCIKHYIGRIGVPYGYTEISKSAEQIPETEIFHVPSK